MSKQLEERVLAYSKDVRRRTYAEATYWLSQYIHLTRDLLNRIRNLQAEVEKKDQRIKELESKNGN